MDNQKTYSYCVSGNTLSVTPQLGGITGTVVLQKSGTVAGTGGASSTGGQPSTGGGPAAGGAPLTGGAPSAGGAATGGAAAGGRTGAGGALTGGATGTGTGVGGVATGGKTGGGGAATGGKTGGGGAATGGVSATGGSIAPGGSSAKGGSSATGGTTSNGTKATLPCDIYAAANNTCVAAHSTIRLLVGSYSGALYQVYRASDKTTKDIPVLSGTIYADSSVQDTFCQGTTCTITKLYDQTGHGNFLEAETASNPVSSVGGYTGETAANATAEKLNVGGHSVYSLYTATKQAYWHNGSTSGMPTGNTSMGIYMVTSGKHYNSGCCYDYGDGETSRTYVAGWSINAIYFGNSTTWGSGGGSGPWVMADLEDGLFAGGSGGNIPANTSQTSTYVTAIEKADGPNSLFALKGGNAASGNLATLYSGKPPKSGMKLQGAVLLGSGGDCCYSNNNGSAGTFYEGAMVTGYPSDATENSVQANIVSAGYGQ